MMGILVRDVGSKVNEKTVNGEGEKVGKGIERGLGLGLGLGMGRRVGDQWELESKLELEL